LSVGTTFAERSRQLEARSQQLEGKGEYERLWRRDTNFLLVDLFEAICRATGVNGFLECGAHDAEASRRFVCSTRDGIAVAVEANPHTYHSKTRSASKLGVTPLNLGVAAQSGRLTLHVPNSRRIDNPSPGNASFLLRSEAVSHYDKIDVEVTTVDKLVLRYLDDRSVALWIDVEGQAEEVLAGAKSTLRSQLCSVVFVEVESHAYWEGQALAPDITDRMAAIGLLPVARDCEFRRQYNIVFVRENLVADVESLTCRYWNEICQVGLGARTRFWQRAFKGHGYATRLPRSLLRKSIGEERYHKLWARRHGETIDHPYE
jgi:FkbM family methyltransferase